MISRRTLLAGAALAPAFLAVRQARAGAIWPLFEQSKLIYVSPLKSDGALSRCKAEIWFAYLDGNLFVVTPPDAWRAEAIGLGLDQAQVWVGEHGVWTESKAFLEAPNMRMTASLETVAETHEAVLAAMGEKYAEDGWGRWGPRFREGLTDGGRVMIRYAPPGMGQTPPDEA